MTLAAPNRTMRLSTAGFLITIFAWTYAPGSPVLATMTGKLQRKRWLPLQRTEQSVPALHGPAHYAGIREGRSHNAAFINIEDLVEHLMDGETAEQPNPSYHNLLHIGFHLAYLYMKCIEGLTGIGHLVEERVCGAPKRHGG